ncbi:hypothetical protein [Halorussus aquaticus]|uniref:Uncharacterized protein n=1 Tax=Halorussus aquaticus TaxID=2953748 RepID=A0ABD5PYR8_9EURY|nr:hypothetical protein [Halorussus aquaticus]
MPSELSRRTLLGGFAVGGTAASVAGYRFLPPDILPAPILEERTKRRSVPEVDTSLPVAPEALESSRAHLREVVDRAAAAWENVDESDVDSEQEEFDRGLESSLEIGREQLAETEGADPTTDALSALRYGVNRAAWSLAAAKAISEAYDLGTLRRRSKRLLGEIDDFVASTSYEVADPRRGLAYCYRTERAIHSARLKADNVPGEDADESDIHQRGVVEAIRSLAQGRRWLSDAKAVYHAHRSNVADAGRITDLEPHLDRTRREFADRIDGLLLDRTTAIERYFPDDGGEGPRERATNELFNNGYSSAGARPPTGRLRSGLLALAAVEHAKALQHARGFTSAMERLDSAFADGGVGMALAARTKREATDRLRRLLADADDPITRELAARPREEIAIGDWPLGVNPQFESEYPHAEAYAMYLLAAENLERTSEIRDALLP